MKILKIELQNLYSLKSDEIICIDLDSAHFKNVGLYAITGPTGAGKTTILDAITIALYHQVPRFKQSNIKAGLKDVISYGASDAMARVLFKNREVVYEASWYMRLVSKNGKVLGKPQEEVRLKNITEGLIIAEKKREVQEAVVRVTQLDYNQFLRSVMLAQGEFASFLSANSKDKGTLLEQITGEEIYKKIGEVISRKLGEERKKLEQISAKLNSDDILSLELKEVLLKEQQLKNIESEEIEHCLKATEKTINWFDTSASLQKDIVLNDSEFQEAEIYKNKQKGILDSLKNHENAARFKDLLKDIGYAEETLIDKLKERKRLDTDLIEMEPQLKKQLNAVALANESKVLAETNFTNWLPKLERIAAVEATMITYSDSIENRKLKLRSYSSEITALNGSLSSLSSVLELRNKEKMELLEYMDKQSIIPKITPYFNHWQQQLFLQSTKTNDLLDAKGILAERTIKSNELMIFISKNEDLIVSENRILVIYSEKSEKLSLEIKKTNLTVILQEKEQVASCYKKGIQLAQLSENFVGNDVLLVKFKNELKEYEFLINDVTKRLKEATDTEVFLKILVEDAEKLLQLETAIKGFDQERLKLEPGKACNLCGATEHPYVSDYVAGSVSDAQKILTERKIKVNDHLQVVLTLHRESATHAGAFKKCKERISEIAVLQTSIQQKASILIPNYDLSKLSLLKEENSALEKKLLGFDLKIKAAQVLITQKSELDVSYTKQQSKCVHLKGGIEAAIVQLSLFKKDIKQKNKEVALVNESLLAIRRDLEHSFSVFNFEIPEPKNADNFIKRLDTAIEKFKLTKEKLQEVAQTVLEIELKRKSEIEIQKKILEQQEVLLKEQEEAVLSFSKLGKDRYALLPKEISLKQQQDVLKLERKTVENHLETQQKDLQQLKEKEINFKGQLLENSKSSKKITPILERLNSTLIKDIKTSIFLDKKELLEAILPAENVVEYENIKKNIDKSITKIIALKESLFLKKEAHDLLKIGDVTCVEASDKLVDFKRRKEDVLRRLGEIKQIFTKDEEVLSRNKTVVDKVKVQEKILKKWVDLMKLLGGSKDAFNTYVQRLTLQNLIAFANIHLFKLNKRYSLQMNSDYKPGEELNFNLIDHYQTDQVRYVDTSSGGEKFIISLALALGLSDLASNNVNIDSLFIDEGFGTLDGATLETVISTLETLQSQGKMIGIISHVDNLKERIPTQIQIHKKSNGVSSVTIV